MEYLALSVLYPGIPAMGILLLSPLVLLKMYLEWRSLPKGNSPPGISFWAYVAEELDDPFLFG